MERGTVPRSTFLKHMTDYRTMTKENRTKKRSLFLLIPILIFVIVGCAFFIYTGIYYHADESAVQALESDEKVHVERTDTGWLFDGPSESNAFIFYPGAKVEETSYAPLLRRIAEQEMDVFLIKVPFRIAFFGADAADKVTEKYSYDRWYIGGHSLGGVVACSYAAKHPEQIGGVILLASYPAESIKNIPSLVSIYGSEDGVLNMKKLTEAEKYVPDNYTSCVIEGGNHAQFGNYGEQKGDGNATISADEQQKQTVEMIGRFVDR